MKPQETVCFNIKVVWHAISRMYNEQALKHGSTAAVGFVLLNIDQKGVPSTKIGPQLGLESTSLTRIVKNLEENELIYKVRDEEDKRLYRVFLTDKGKSYRDKARQVVKDFNQEVRNEIPEKKLEVFFEVMEKINSIIDERKVFSNSDLSSLK
jgi:DNA-binding MarR family transcriptional regulator